jgi:hypothetical protein
MGWHSYSLLRDSKGGQVMRYVRASKFKIRFCIRATYVIVKQEDGTEGLRRRHCLSRPVRSCVPLKIRRGVVAFQARSWRC